MWATAAGWVLLSLFGCSVLIGAIEQDDVAMGGVRCGQWQLGGFCELKMDGGCRPLMALSAPSLASHVVCGCCCRQHQCHGSLLSNIVACPDVAVDVPCCQCALSQLGLIWLLWLVMWHCFVMAGVIHVCHGVVGG